MSTAALGTRPLSPRLRHLRDQVMARKGSFVTDANPFTPAVALWRAMVAGPSHGPSGRPHACAPSTVQVRAAYLRELVAVAPIEVEAGWRIVGNHLPTAHLPLASPEPGNPEHERLVEALGVSRLSVGEIGDAVHRWQSRGPAAHVGMPEDRAFLGERDPEHPTTTAFWSIGWVENHSIRDYATVLQDGFAGIGDRIRRLLESEDITDPEYPRRESFRRAALEICEAGALLGARYADAVGRGEETAPETESAVATATAAVCRRVPRLGARTFREAVQALWFAHILTCGEDGINANSIGRMDQFLFPYFDEDMRAGRITRHDAVELMEELALRLYLEYDVQAITLGGVDAEGRDAVNELSYIILEASRNVGFVRDLSVRLHSESPPAFVDSAARSIAAGGGIPFIFNDECFIPALIERGISLQDARDYAPIGCVELTIPGKASPHAVSGELCAAKCLELALFDGRDPATGIQLGPRTGMLTDHDSFETLVSAYQRQVECFADRMVYLCNHGELRQQAAGPLPCWSVLTDDCILRGRDITDGGALYNYHSICFIGTANVADSLYAVKRLVFDTEELAPQQLLDSLRVNFAGNEDLRLRLAGLPKYGNDIPDVDEIAAGVATHFIAYMDTKRSPLGGRYFVHLFSFLWNLEFGKSVGATPDGRRRGEPLAYSLSAQQGRDTTGITALIQSLSRLPHNQTAGGSAAILELDPVVVEGPDGHRLLTQLICSALHMGVGQMQWNVVTAERLRRAQQDPERYGNIPVRVAGYSQMFRLVPKELQEHIIARTKHRV